MHAHAVIFGLALVGVCWLYSKKLWRVRRAFDSDLTKTRSVPSGRPVAPAYRKKHEMAIARGMALATKSRVLVVSMVRDVIEQIPMIIDRAEVMGKLFDDYRILIVENDSTDHTREALLRWARSNPKVEVLGCGVNAKECRLPKAAKTQKHAIAYDRIAKMSRLRNIYLEEIRKRYSRGWDFAIMWDLDAVATTYDDGVYHALGIMDRHDDIGVVCANGIYDMGFFSWFYDTYAIAEKHDPYFSDLHETYNLRKGLHDFRYGRGDPKVEVESCFSGLAIYRVKDLVRPGVTYPLPDPDNVVCEHALMHATLPVRKVVDPSFLNVMHHNP